MGDLQKKQLLSLSLSSPFPAPALKTLVPKAMLIKFSSWISSVLCYLDNSELSDGHIQAWWETMVLSWYQGIS